MWLCWLGGPVGAPAHGHPEISPTTVNRYLTAAVLGDQLEVSLSLLFGPLPAAEERQRIDRDGDGRLSEGEVEAARERWQRAVSSLFTAEVDGAALNGTLSLHYELNDKRRVGAFPLVVMATVRVPIRRQTHTFTLAPAGAVPRAGETELALTLGPDWRLRESGLGKAERARGHATSFKLGPQAGRDDVARFVIEPAVAAGATRSSSPPAALVVMIGSALIAAVLFVWWRVSRR